MGDDEVEAVPGRRVRWRGFGLQQVVMPAGVFSVGLRAEWFRDADGVRTGGTGGVDVWNVSVAPAFRLTERLTLRVESRFDRADEDVFEDSDGLPRDRQVTLSGEIFLRF